jgi:tRNA-2-methylthio-N6-dimethylallyladenosine synthase
VRAETEVSTILQNRYIAFVGAAADVAGIPPGRAVFIETYGCQMNAADSELIAGVLSSRGFLAVGSPDDADVILLNTCAIREHAEERVAQRVRQLISDRRRGERRVRIGLAGCMAQHHRDRLLDTIPGLDFVVGPDGYRRLPDLIDAESPVAEVRLDRTETYDDIAPSRVQGVRAWLTIMRGCDRFCTFCVVPFVRGRERSLPTGVLLDEANRIARDGYKEVVLLGQTVNAYHHDRHDFASLLRLLSDVPGIERIRFTSPHPADMTAATIETMRACPKIAPYLHLPLQSGSDRMLAAMDRGHDVTRYLDLVDRLRSAIPGLALSTDIIVGYPGETDVDFAATRRVMQKVGYDHAFLFKYSPREGTRSYRVPETVTEEEKQQRLATLIADQEERAARINRALVGQVTEVLVESRAKRQPGWLAGKNPQFKTVVFEPTDARMGDLVDVRIEAAGSHTLRGRQISKRDR